MIKKLIPMITKITQTILFSALLTFNAHSQLFSEVTAESEINLVHSNDAPRQGEPTFIGAGGAVGDYDFDGYPDFYLIAGTNQHNALYHNLGNGQFTDLANTAQVDLFDILGSGPVFADVDGDFDLDLLVFSVNQQGETSSGGNSIKNRPRLFINLGNGTFMESMNSGFFSGMSSYSGTFGDLDKDGDLDLFMTHWSSDNTTSKQLFWENDGFGGFTDVTIDYLGLSQNAFFDKWTFTPNFTDINDDGWLDVLLTSDFGTTRILYSTGFPEGQPAYLVSQPPFITDENGMGAAVADYDNDGDMDWFVTSIWDPNGVPEANWGTSGNRLYRNIGMGDYEDVTETSGVREGYWGWGACFADFNNDGHLDIYHENGFPIQGLAAEFIQDPARLFMSNGDGTFTESASINGLNHTDQGRGVSCVDYDLDGDIDILVMPNNSAYKLYKNNSNSNNNYMDIKLFDTGNNPYAYQAKIVVNTNQSTQTRELTGGNNYVSNNPLTQHYGLGNETQVNNIQITWPDGTLKTINNNIDINQINSISRYCHSRFHTKIYSDVSTNTNSTLYLHNLDGSPISGSTVNLSITRGPNSGFTQDSVSDNNGLLSFSLPIHMAGTDRLEYNFMADGAPQICRSLVEWSTDIIFKNTF